MMLAARSTMNPSRVMLSIRPACLGPGFQDPNPVACLLQPPSRG
jgi:hypothetical protein